MCQFHKEAIIAPSILSADFTNLGADVVKLFQNNSDWIHIDIMDGHFVPNISIGLPVIQQLRKLLPNKDKYFFDCHMMVQDPEKWVEEVAKFGANQFTFHLETTKNPLKLIRMIKQKGLRAGCAIKPGTPVDKVIPLVAELDMVLVMTVEPGFGGQSFMPEMMSKVQRLKSLAQDSKSEKFNVDIQVDGGVGPQNVHLAAKAGANVIVAGTSVFRAKDQAKMIQYLRKRVNQLSTNRSKL